MIYVYFIKQKHLGWRTSEKFLLNNIYIYISFLFLPLILIHLLALLEILEF